ncbi:hypothetical protein N3K66_005285 [Trichothecium roseum]|uniref:Uncharacterized protein n=1 Tax=Trichothecium roseum TaxID=47278 RepID=A0ACC0UXF8_9HYPO|nr:hypothetical protein N3K66_005285 [Trichothecium roseum]
MAKGNPKDSMRSTWRLSDRKEWTYHHWIIEYLNVHPVDLDKDIPKHDKGEKMPFLAQWPQHGWVLFHALLPLAAHQAWLTLTGYESLGKLAAFNLYFVAFNAVIVREVQVLRRLGHKFGFLDGDNHDRDGVPDVGVGRVAKSLYKTTGSRLLLAVLLSYNTAVSPLDAVTRAPWWLWLVVEIGVYGIVLDFWFYWYHRAMHDVDGLWKYHRTHHLTKHPNALLTAYADHEQEFFDMVGVPLATYATMKLMGFPLGFYEWWICHQYVAFTEVLGHSGLRIHLTAPSTLSWLLRYFNAEIVTEDHDLHHRKGYRKAHNYGKQTRLWDRIFGTCHERIESREENVDYDTRVVVPIL